MTSRACLAQNLYVMCWWIVEFVRFICRRCLQIYVSWMVVLRLSGLVSSSPCIFGSLYSCGDFLFVSTISLFFCWLLPLHILQIFGTRGLYAYKSHLPTNPTLFVLFIYLHLSLHCHGARKIFAFKRVAFKHDILFWPNNTGLLAPCA